jgi:hypothetical protein
MNENSVYIKTDAGEDAVTKRTIVQRNLRSVLIMIDGRTPVGNLAQQFGDPLIVEGLVGELEHRGLVRKLDAQSGDSEADRSELSSIMVDIEELVSQPITPVADDIRRAHDKSSAQDSPVIDEFAMALPELSAPTAAAAPAASASPGALSPEGEDVRGAIRRAMISSGGDAAQEARPAGPFRRIADLFAGRVGGAERRGAPGPLWKKILGGVAVLLIALIGLFFLYPYDRHLPQMEKLVSELLGQPVRIQSASPSLFPQPSIALEGLSVGDGGQLDIAAVKLIPRISSLLGERTEMREVRVEGARLNVAFLPALSRQPDINWASRWVKVEKVTMVDSSLLLLGGALTGLSGDLDISDDGALTRLSLASADGALKTDGVIESGVWRVSLTAFGWQTPGTPSMLFDVLEASGTLNSQRLQIDKLDIKLYDGYATGHIELDWADKTRFEGDVTATRLGLGSVVGVFAPKLLLTGDLSASLVLKGEGAQLADLQRSLSASGTVSIQRGQMERVDLVQAVRIPRPGGVRGGSTRFDQLDADIVADADGLMLENVKMESGLVGAVGKARLAGGKINGRFDVNLQGTATTVRAPVSIEGSYADPIVKLLR